MNFLNRTERPQRGIMIFNIVVIILILALFFGFNAYYNKSMEKQNIDNISNLNQTSEKLAGKVFENEQTILSDAAQYIMDNDYTVAEALDFLSAMNASDASSFELVGTDYTGYYVDMNGEHKAVDYSSTSYSELQKTLKTASEDTLGYISFSPEFTDKMTGKKCFALSLVLSLKDDGGNQVYYTLMNISQSSNFIDMISVQGDYENMGTALLDNQGNYIIGDVNYKSNNFFKYIYVFNDLSLDERKALEKKVLGTEEGNLFYKDSQNRDCIFTYRNMAGYDWYIMTTVPISDFRTQSMNYSFAILLVAILGLLFIVNIAWQRMVNRRLKVSAENERKANSAKSDFLSRMSHDIRTPLNAVIGFSELVTDEPDLSDSVRDSIDKINSSGQYLLSLVNDILDMSKIENDKMELNEETVNGVKFLNDIADVFAAQAKLKGINLVTDFREAKTPWVVMDPLRSKQIYSNLLSNALKFTPPGGTITWTMVDEVIDEDTMHMKSVISDTGCGMSEEFLTTLFTPFEQEPHNAIVQETGTGLGLAIVKSLVDLMGGTIEVDSKLDEGSRFTIELDRKISCSLMAREEESQLMEDEISLVGKKVLLCEDHELNREIASRLLGKKDIIVDMAVNGKEGLEIFENSDAGYYDAILMDIRMPVMDGLEATRQIRALSREDAKEIPIIAMTANAFEEDMENSREAGINVHLAKPINPQQLYKVLQQQIK